MNAPRNVYHAAVTLFITGIAAALVAAGTPDTRTDAIQSHAQHPEHALNPEAERARIRTHLLGAERIMKSADVSHLTDAQREGRARVIALLHEYRVAGVFPHNHDFPGERIPYFTDRHGTLCAMAYLIAHTGGEEFVARVSRTANNAYVADLAADPAFRDWLDRHGMTVAEAARVQPGYDCCFIGPSPVRADDANTEYALASAGSAALSGAAVALQLLDDGPRDGWRTVFGIAAGGIGLGLAAVGLQGTSGTDGTPGDEHLATLNLGLGAAALGVAVWRALRPPQLPGESDDAEPSRKLSWFARPALGRDGGYGFRVTVRF